MKILAVDYGRKRIGFAIGNKELNIATPLDVITNKNKKQIIAHILQLIEEYSVRKILVGYPLNMDGTVSSFTKEVEGFTLGLKKKMSPGISIEFMDERLSTFEAEEILKNCFPDFRKRKKIKDSMAALMILQRFLEK